MGIGGSISPVTSAEGTSDQEEPAPGATPPPPPGFFFELAEAFRRHRPQGSARWNFSDAFTRLEEQVGSPPAGTGTGPVGTEAATVAGDRDARARHNPARRLLDRSVADRLAWWVDERAAAAARRATKEALGERPDAVTAGFDATLEAFRFLAARVERLEEAAADRRDPIDGMAWLVPGPELGPWTAPVVEWVARAYVAGEVVHGECGDGGLAVALAAAGLPVRGAEPRGSVAWEAAERGVDVHLGPVEELLGSAAPGSLGGLVLSGVVDRLPVDELVALVSSAADRLAGGAPLVVVSATPSTVAVGWDAVARDLVPGRPLHAETWALLLARAGYEEVGPLEGPAGQPTYALKGRRPR